MKESGVDGTVEVHWVSVEATGMDKISFKFSGMTLVGSDDDPLVKATFVVLVEGKKSGSLSITEPTSAFGMDGKPIRRTVTMAVQNAQANLARLLESASAELRQGHHLPPAPDSLT